MADIPASENRPNPIERGRAEFGGITLDWKDKELLLGWFAETPFKNVVWVRLIQLRLGWPPIGYLCGFIFTDEGGIRR